MAIDPICKMMVDEKSVRYRSEYKGTTYYFCAPGCKKIFDESPEIYIGGENRGNSEEEHK
ncbi:YHS domain-containing protein [candidate division WOR-3 bacterium]|nr:YHS domain-containing protein [candidate division WOR-3 bacterium]